MKLIVSDMDGTLLNSNSELSIENENAIKQIQNTGTKFVLASGRPLAAMRSFYERLDSDYVISFNGGLIYDVKNDSIVYKKTLSKDKVKMIYEYAQKNDLSLITYKDNQILCNRFDEYTNIEVKYTKLDYKIINDFNFESVKCMLVSDPDNIKKHFKYFTENFGDDFCTSISDPHFLEITEKNVDKGIALTKLYDTLSIDKNDTIAIGDSYNDLPMLKVAGFCIAPSNAKPEIKDVADYISCSNNENIMVDILAKYYKGNI